MRQPADAAPLRPLVVGAKERQNKPDALPVAGVTKADAELRLDPVPTQSDALLWTSAIVVAALIHAGLAWFLLFWSSPEALPEESPPAVMIELAPIAVAPTADPQEAAPGSEMSEAHPQTARTPTQKTVEASEPNSAPEASDRPIDAATPTTQPDASTRPTVDPPTIPAVPPIVPAGSPVPHTEDGKTRQLPSLDDEVNFPELPRLYNAEADPSPPPSPTIQASKAASPPLQPACASKPAEQKPLSSTASPPKVAAPKRAAGTKEPVERSVRHKKIEKLETPAEASRTSAPPTSNVRLANVATSPASSASGAPSAALASWKGEVVAHLNRFKRFPPGAANGGVAAVAFSIDRAGAVLSARVVGSSGEPLLDQEAVALPRRASPVPAPPRELGQGVITLTVPIRFSR